MISNSALTGDSRSASNQTTIAVPGAPPRRMGNSPQTERAWTLPGLCWNAAVMTSFGALPAQVLRKHDPLRLTDGAIARIAWVDKIQLDEAFLDAFADAQPVLIRAGALGRGLPTRDLLVSPHQKVAVSGANFTTDLRLARDLLGRPGVMRQPQKMVTYHLFHVGNPARVSVEGLSLYTAP